MARPNVEVSASGQLTDEQRRKMQSQAEPQPSDYRAGQYKEWTPDRYGFNQDGTLWGDSGEFSRYEGDEDLLRFIDEGMRSSKRENKQGIWQRNWWGRSQDAMDFVKNYDPRLGTMGDGFAAGDLKGWLTEQGADVHRMAQTPDGRRQIIQKWIQETRPADAWEYDLGMRAIEAGYDEEGVEKLAREMESKRISTGQFDPTDFDDKGRLQKGPTSQYTAAAGFNALNPDNIDPNNYVTSQEQPETMRAQIERLNQLEQEYRNDPQIAQARRMLEQQEDGLQRIRRVAYGDEKTVAELQRDQMQSQARRAVFSQLASSRGGFNPGLQRAALFATAQSSASVAADVAARAQAERLQMLGAYLSGTSALTDQAANFAAQQSGILQGIEQRRAGTEMAGLAFNENQAALQRQLDIDRTNRAIARLNLMRDQKEDGPGPNYLQAGLAGGTALAGALATFYGGGAVGVPMIMSGGTGVYGALTQQGREPTTVMAAGRPTAGTPQMDLAEAARRGIM